MKKLIIILLSMGIVSAASAESIEDRLSEVEVNQSLNIWSFGGRLINTYDSYGIKQGAEKNEFDQLRTLFLFDMTAKPSDRLFFYGRLSYAKYWNQVSLKGTGDGTGDLQRTYSKESGADVSVDKAYADFMITDSLALSIGRLPTSQGTPTHHYMGEGRLATYPRLSFNSFLDGIALSYSRNNLSYRMLYTPITYFGEAGSVEAGPDKDLKNHRANNNKRDLAGINDLASAMVEYNNNKFSWADNVIAILQYSNGSIAFEDFKDMQGMDDIMGFGDGNIYSDVNYGLSNLTLHFEADNILNKGVNTSVTWLQTSTTSDGNFNIDLGGDGSIDLPPQGLLTNPGETVTGSGLLLAASWDITPKNRIGFEHLMSDKNYNAFDTAGEDLDNFYETKGSASHVYYVRKVTDGFNVTIGYKMTEKKFDNLLDNPVGARVELVDGAKKTTNAYVMSNMSF